ncbi:hypothetical protein ATI61_101459 [Archangium gephyra]|uniref:Uncharacterized protein n=1 Tax=Archangium gephyra TaxID=48 RepID=A0AAC8TFU3_9BACT|nr:DUF6544 family protein [Archangium gephyra]AKJ04452.1 Hypothetical protein AA314_06078 [Archangium gephyra]REG37475.1 hypothetical protein ATI61_101459 [Archangium gephyra]
MNLAAAVFLLLHGFAHLVGFVGAWRLSSTVPYKTTILNGRFELGDGGVRVFGILWLLAALTFAVAAVGAFLRSPWWGTLTLLIALFSGVLCVLSWPEAKLGLLVNVALIALVALGAMARGKNLEGLYQAEVAAELAKHPVNAPGLITENGIAGLPPPVQRYFRASGFIGKPHTLNVRLHWSGMQLKRSHDADWMELSCQQFNSVAEPMRLALMKGRMAGVIPFEGKDKYQDGHGNMLIKLMKLITVGDSKGTSMDESALVTVLSETFMAPSYALQGYMKWQPVDERSARAELTSNGITVSGIFHFNEADELVRFDTNDRWQDGTPPKKLPWSAHLEGYRMAGGIRYATRVSATWHEPTGDYTYVKGTIDSVEFNVRN